jgi:preprotein translocase subunit SecF
LNKKRGDLMGLMDWYKKVVGRTYKEKKKEISRSKEALKLEKDLGIATNYLQQVNDVYSKLIRGRITLRQASKLEKQINTHFKEALAYSILFIFVAVGIYTSIYLRDSITGFAVFTNNNPGFDLASLLFIGAFVFLVYLYVNHGE